LILLVAVVVGLLAGLARARYYGRPFILPGLRFVWLAAIVFLPQWLVFFFGPTRNLFSDQIAGFALVISQIGLLLFGWINRGQTAFKLLMLGLSLNLLVIVSNGGLMPISPETLHLLVPSRPADTWEVGRRFGTSKDRILAEADTNFAWLSDRFVTPTWISYKVAYSVGDVLIAAGACLFLWSAGGAFHKNSAVSPNESIKVP
jgi:hypothetical protein